MPEINDLNPPAIRGEAVAGRASFVRKSLVLLSGTISKNTFDVADLLYEAQESGYLQNWGYSNIGDYAEKELGIKERKAQYLVRIVKVCRELGLKREQYEPAGVSNLRDITTLDPQGSYWNPETKASEPLDDLMIDLIIEAVDLTKEDVAEEVMKLKGQVGPDRPVLRNYKVTRSAWENVIKAAFEQMRLKLGSSGRDDAGMAKEYSDGVCVEMICAEWLAGEALEAEEAKVIPMEVPLEKSI